jgi:hypothetical protein
MLLGQWQSRHPNAVAHISPRISESAVPRPTAVQLKAVILSRAGSNKTVPKSPARGLGSVVILPSNRVGPAYDLFFWWRAYYVEVELIVVLLGWPWRSSWCGGTRTILRLANALANSSTKGN